MKLQVTNKQIFFAVENCFDSLPFNFRVQLHNLVKANDAEDFVQEVEIDADTFVKVMLAVNSQPQGIAKDVNPEFHLSLKNQILAQAMPILTHLSTLTDETEIAEYKEANKEILTIAERVKRILNDNLQMLENKIINGKTQILG